MGYNVQTAVDSKHSLIVAHEVTNEYGDRGQLFSMALQAQAAMAVDELEVVADRGYFKNTEIQKCAESGISVIVSRPQSSHNKAKGLFGREDFHYIPEDDEYRVPGGRSPDLAHEAPGIGIDAQQILEFELSIMCT